MDGSSVWRDRLNNDLFFETFPSGGPWHLQWINWLHRNPTDPFDPLIQCLFVNVGRGKDRGRTVKASAASGWLPWLIIGSTWLNKRPMRMHYPDWESGAFDVAINETTLTEFDGFDREGPDQPYILDPKAYRLHRRGVKMVGVRIGSDPYALVIPAMVLAQFYLGTSTALAQALLGGTFVLDPSRLYDPARTRQEENGVFRIGPGPGFTSGDAPSLARFLAAPDESPERAAYRLPFLAACSAAAGQQHAPLFATFPFHGETSLRVKGRRYTVRLSDGTTVVRFLVLQMESCTGPFPYKKLIIDSEEVDPDPASEEAGHPWLHAVDSDAPKHLVHDRRPNRHLPPCDLAGPPVSQRFLALEEIPIETEVTKRAAETPPAVHVPGDALAPDSGATGPSTSDNGSVRQTRAITEEDQDRTSTVERPMAKVFADMLATMAQSPAVANVASVVLCSPTHQVGSFQFGETPEHANGGWWHKIDPDTTRLLLIGECTLAGRWMSFMCVEPRPKHPKDWEGVMLVARGDGNRVALDDLGSVVEVIRHRYHLWGERVNRQPRSKAFAGLSTALRFACVNPATAMAEDLADAVLQAAAALHGAHTATAAGGESSGQAVASNPPAAHPRTKAS